MKRRHRPLDSMKAVVDIRRWLGKKNESRPILSQVQNKRLRCLGYGNAIWKRRLRLRYRPVGNVLCNSEKASYNGNCYLIEMKSLTSNPPVRFTEMSILPCGNSLVCL